MKERGSSLIEIVVAMGLSAMLLTVLMQLYVHIASGERKVNTLIDLQQRGRYLSFFLEPGRLKRLIGGVGSSRMSFHQCRSSSNDCFRLCAKNNVKHCVKVFYARSSLVGANKKPIYAIYIKRNQKRAHAVVLGVAKLRVFGWKRTQTEWARLPVNQLQSTKNIDALELHVSLKPLGLIHSSPKSNLTDGSVRDAIKDWVIYVAL